jgi:hypothetical protein
LLLLPVGIDYDQLAQPLTYLHFAGEHTNRVWPGLLCFFLFRVMFLPDSKLFRLAWL